MPDTIEEKAMRYLHKKLKHARISLEKAMVRGHADEIAGLKNKIEVLEWLAEIALKLAI